MTSTVPTSGSRRTVTKVSKVLEMQNSLGMHARPAALFVKTASRFESEIEVDCDGNCVSGKSIMGLLMLEAQCGAMLKVTAVGSDAAEAIKAIQQLMRYKFYEDEFAHLLTKDDGKAS